MPVVNIIKFLLVFEGVLLLATSISAQPTPAESPASLGDKTDLWQAARQSTVSEEVYLLLSERLRGLNRSLQNLKLPDEKAQTLFAPNIEVLDLLDSPVETVETNLPSHLGVHSIRWPLRTTDEHRKRAELDLWQPMLQQFAWFETASFKIEKGSLFEQAGTIYRAQMHFTARGHVLDGAIVVLRGDIQVDWRYTENGESDKKNAWLIERWQTLSLEGYKVQKRLFREVLRDIVADANLFERAQRSIHEEYVTAYLKNFGQFKLPTPAFDPVSHDRHPGVAVVDIDNDGWDDLYVMARWGKNMLFRNRGDGTFEEVAERFGLDIEDHTSSAVFADFDNDGDPDVFLGRTLARSLLLMNENGHFVDRSGWGDRLLPMLVSSVAAADYDRDGLLDLYISTYALKIGAGADSTLSQPNSEHQTQMWASHHPIYNAWGPANVLLHNQGAARFKRVENSGLEVYRHTYQGTWGDYDKDGDPDLYVVNDYAVNNLFRNDGSGNFEDVTAETGTADVGFGMGATWGDYDNDGREDLYVSNMFSKAGKRVTHQIPGLDVRFAKMARGNTLFRNLDDRFESVSGLSPPQLLVEKTGWSWGSQFADVDNDGWQDLIVLNGSYTAPASVALPVDM